MQKRLLTSLLVLLLFTGCEDIYTRTTAAGSTTTTTTTTPSAVLSGIFVDSPVAGLNYTTYTTIGSETASLTGSTDSQGIFYYNSGEYVEFKLGAVPIGSRVLASSIITPLTVSGGGTDITKDDEATNIARFLQSLDADTNTSNGITINSNAITTASGSGSVYFRSSLASFAAPINSSDIQTFAKTILDANASTLLSSTVAQTDFNNSIGLEFNTTYIDGTFYALWDMGTRYTVYTFNKPSNNGSIREQRDFDANESDLSITSWTFSNGTLNIAETAETLTRLATMSSNTHIVSNDYDSKGVGIFQKGSQSFTISDINQSTFYLLNPNGNYAIYDFTTNKAIFAEDKNATLAWNIVAGKLEVNSTLTNTNKIDDTFTYLVNRDTNYLVAHTLDLNNTAQYTNRLVSLGKTKQKFYASRIPGTYYTVTDKGYYAKVTFNNDYTGTINYYKDTGLRYNAASYSLTWSVNSSFQLVITTTNHTGSSVVITEELKAVSDVISLAQSSGDTQGSYKVIYKQPTIMTAAKLAGTTSITYSVQKEDYNTISGTHTTKTYSEFDKITFYSDLTGQEISSSTASNSSFTWTINSSGDILRYQNGTLYSTLTIMRNYNNELRIHEQYRNTATTQTQNLYVFTKN